MLFKPYATTRQNRLDVLNEIKENDGRYLTPDISVQVPTNVLEEVINALPEGQLRDDLILWACYGDDLKHNPGPTYAEWRAGE